MLPGLGSRVPPRSALRAWLAIGREPPLSFLLGGATALIAVLIAATVMPSVLAISTTKAPSQDLRGFGTGSSLTGRWREAGFELSVPRHMGNGFEALSETGPIGYWRRGLIRAVAGFAEYPDYKELGGFPAYQQFVKARW